MHAHQEGELGKWSRMWKNDRKDSMMTFIQHKITKLDSAFKPLCKCHQNRKMAGSYYNGLY